MSTDFSKIEGLSNLGECILLLEKAGRECDAHDAGMVEWTFLAGATCLHVWEKELYKPMTKEAWLDGPAKTAFGKGKRSLQDAMNLVRHFGCDEKDRAKWPPSLAEGLRQWKAAKDKEAAKSPAKLISKAIAGGLHIDFHDLAVSELTPQTIVEEMADRMPDGAPNASYGEFRAWVAHEAGEAEAIKLDAVWKRLNKELREEVNERRDDRIREIALLPVPNTLEDADGNQDRFERSQAFREFAGRVGLTEEPEPADPTKDPMTQWTPVGSEASQSPTEAYETHRCATCGKRGPCPPKTMGKNGFAWYCVEHYPKPEAGQSTTEAIQTPPGASGEVVDGSGLPRPASPPGTHPDLGNGEDHTGLTEPDSVESWLADFRAMSASMIADEAKRLELVLALVRQMVEISPETWSVIRANPKKGKVSVSIQRGQRVLVIAE